MVIDINLGSKTDEGCSNYSGSDDIDPASGKSPDGSNGATAVELSNRAASILTTTE